ncbi:hypothetical protein [Mesoplasma melaleucae]|uniref:Uncharacterized protein n=1 Tax=Mesoplasma melaleucae TaxID=81459 RepID=A0A2K8NWV8_9MOLU|nr:hypothetical protein [Mesoplasma melaleucae]ATZ18320.1 hypothetical protein EMELA_v1c08360 [Mesoplasma melaleucae]
MKIWKQKTLYIIGIILNIIGMSFLALFALIYRSVAIVAAKETKNAALVRVLVLVFCLISLAWILPITLMARKAYKQVGTKEEQAHMVLAICTLLFVGLISCVFIYCCNSFFCKCKR